jgi:lipoate---protein ligase
MHGEFKTPGGKLIAADFDRFDGKLHNVVVTGDFFLYPEETLPVLAGALEGVPATLAATEYAALVRSAMTPDMQLLGSSPEALATAVVRALQVQEQGVGVEHGDN